MRGKLGPAFGDLIYAPWEELMKMISKRFKYRFTENFYVAIIQPLNEPSIGRRLRAV